MSEGNARVLVVGGSDELRTSIAAALRKAGGYVADAASLKAAPPRHLGIPYDLVVLLGDDVHSLCKAVRAHDDLADTPVVAVVAPDADDDGDAALGSGADEVFYGVPDANALAAFVRRVLRNAPNRARQLVSERMDEVLLDVLALGAAGADPLEIVSECLARATPLLGHTKGSVLLTMDDQAFVVAASDDATLTRQPLDLARYPEVKTALHENEVVVVDDVLGWAPLQPWLEPLAQSQVRAIAVFPISWRGHPIGALTFRATDPMPPLGDRRIAFGRLVAALIAQRVSGGTFQETLREATRRTNIAKLERERRLRAIDALSEFFEASADGMIVVDGDGEILFVNRAAETITGWARSGLLQRSLSELVPEVQREGLSSVISEVLGGTNLEPFDLDLTTTSGDPICVSVATATVLAGDGAAILSFRDVTAERALETELRKTKEFLEKLIDSAVDAIIAADVEGNVILFNPGAERLFGWRVDEVIGRLPVERLYPEGVARQVMRMLRAASYGGSGRLELTRREIQTKDGEIIPVNMTASILYEDGVEVATVGIIADLRERIKIEQRLLQAQEKLLATEKQALVAELAGATAHELNQPLQSVMGYAELLRKKMTPDDPYRRGIDTILNEATRMAEIVKQIGRITRYETKQYVGTAQILDLEKSSRVEAVDPDAEEKTGPREIDAPEHIHERSNDR